MGNVTKITHGGQFVCFGENIFSYQGIEGKGPKVDFLLVSLTYLKVKCRSLQMLTFSLSHIHCIEAFSATNSDCRRVRFEPCALLLCSICTLSMFLLID